MDIPIPREPVVPSSWFTKFTECFFGGLIPGNILLLVASLFPQSTLIKLGPLLLAILLFGQLVTGITFGIGFSIPWHKRENRNHSSSEKIHGWLRGMLRYWLAMMIAYYGFGKLFRTQFATSFKRADIPVGQLNGFELTWNYFGHSYPLAVTIGLLQIGGAILLLFRRSTLFGVVLLLPVMVNIVLIILLYKIAPGAFLNSILFTLGLLYLLLLNRSALIKVFWPPVDPPPVRLGFLKQVFRFLAIGAPFGIIFYFVSKSPVSPLAGKWTVDRLVRNRDTVKANTWLTDTTAWTTVYIEERSTLTLCPNPYIFDAKKSRVAQYIYKKDLRQMQLIFFNKINDTIRFQVRQPDDRGMQWDGIIDNDTVSMQLSRAKVNF
jgi:hypothetical protein